MLAELVVIVIMVAMDGSLLDRSVHAFDLAIGPGKLDLGQPVINVVSGASTLKCVTPEQLSFRSHLPDIRRCPARTSWAHDSTGTKIDPSLIVEGMFSTDSAHHAALKLLDRPDRPTAIITISNLMSVGLLFAMKERKIRVPQEISMIGTDDLDIAELFDPVPTVVATPVTGMARRAIEMLIDEIESGSPPEGKWDIWKPKLVPRASTAPVSVTDLTPQQIS